MGENLREWFRTFCSTREIERVDGRNLYAYRVTGDEYQTLRHAIEDYVTSNLFIQTQRQPPLFCWAVVLYASEWWRREYKGGPWKWEPILKPIGLGDLLPNQRTDLIRWGLTYWSLPPPSHGGKAYFGAIVAQGGLPLFAIQEGAGTNLERVMTSVLQQASRYRWSEQQVIEAVGYQANSFAQSLQNEEFYALVAQMIRAALRLKEECQLSDAQNPLATLDAKHPDWRNEFPIDLDDAAAVRLLNGLVEEASRTKTAANKAVFSVDRLLHPVSHGLYELQSLITYPQTISGEELKDFVGFESELPGHFTIDAGVGIRKALTHARSSLGTQEMFFKLTLQQHRWVGQTACEEHLLYLRGHTGDLLDKPIPIPGGNALSSLEPWLFAPVDEEYRLAATGDARLRDSEILLAVKQDWTVFADGDIQEDFGVLRFENDERRLVRLRPGTVQVKSLDDIWDIRVGVTNDESAQYFLEGIRVPLRTSPWPLFRGMPRVVYYDDDGQRHEVLRKDMRLSRPGTDKPIQYQGASPPPGLVHLSIVKGDKRLGRLRFGVIEPTSRETYRSSNVPSQGYIDLSGWGAFTFDNHTANVEMGVNTDSAGKRKIHLQAEDKPPGYIPVSLNWPGSRFALKVRLPFPATGGCAYDEQDRPIDSGKTIPLGRLLGKRILVFDANPDYAAQYKLELTLSSSSAAPTREFPVRLESNRAEIRLADYSREMESLLAFSDNLDTCVAVTLTADRMPVFRLNVSRYDTQPLWRETAVIFPAEFIETLTPEQLTKAKALAVSLVSPGNPQPMEQEILAGQPTGRWPVDCLPEQDPWLIIPTADSSVSFRPTIVDRRQDVPFTNDSGLCEFAQAMQYSNAELRSLLIDSRLEEMASDFTSPSWDFFAQLWHAFKHLPLCSLDVFRQLALRPDLAVSVLFAPQEDFCELSRRLRHELGMILELVHVAIWRKTVGQLCNYYKKLLKETADSVLPTILDNKFKALTQEWPNHRLLFDMLWVEAGGEASEYFQEVQQAQKQSPGSFGKKLWQGDDSLVQHYLLRVHANDQWPESPSFLEQVLPELNKRLDAASQTVISRNGKSFFWLEGNKYKLSVTNIPAAFALWTAYNSISKSKVI